MVKGVTISYQTKKREVRSRPFEREKERERKLLEYHFLHFHWTDFVRRIAKCIRVLFFYASHSVSPLSQPTSKSFSGRYNRDLVGVHLSCKMATRKEEEGLLFIALVSLASSNESPISSYQGSRSRKVPPLSATRKDEREICFLHRTIVLVIRITPPPPSSPPLRPLRPFPPPPLHLLILRLLRLRSPLSSFSFSPSSFSSALKIMAARNRLLIIWIRR